MKNLLMKENGNIQAKNGQHLSIHFQRKKCYKIKTFLRFLMFEENLEL